MSFKQNPVFDKLLTDAIQNKKVLEHLDYDELFRFSKYLIELNKNLKR